jgi:hypothetical protein
MHAFPFLAEVYIICFWKINLRYLGVYLCINPCVNALRVNQCNFVRLEARLYLKLSRWQRVTSFEWLLVATGVAQLTFDEMPQGGEKVGREAKFKFGVYE